jgi:Haloacid dehalogenase-like hydrolase
VNRERRETYNFEMYPKKPIDIETFDKETFDDWLASFEVVLCDCDGERISQTFVDKKSGKIDKIFSHFSGVLWLHDNLYEGTNVVINKLIDMGKKVYLITNNNQTTREEMAEKAKKMNFNLELVSEKKTENFSSFSFRR